MVSGSRKENIAVNQIQVGQVETKEKRHDEEIKPPPRPLNSPTRQPKECTYISVLKQSNGSVVEQSPKSSAATSCEISSHSSKSQRTSVSSINLDGILQHSSSSEPRIVSQFKRPSNDAFGRVSQTDDNVHITYKSEANVKLKITGKRGIALSSSTVDKSTDNEKSGSSHPEGNHTNAVESGTSDEKEVSSVKETFSSFKTETNSSVTRESYTCDESYHTNKQVANGRSESYTDIESETRQNFHSFQNERHQIDQKPGNVASDLWENLQDEKLNPKFSSCSESNEQHSLDRSSANGATDTTREMEQNIKTNQNNSLSTESNNNSIPNSQKPSRERRLDTDHKQIFDSSSKDIERSNDKGLCKKFNTTANESQMTTENSSKETRSRLSRKDQLRVAMDWQHKLQLQVETLSWKYKSLEVEYDFLEKLIAEQREDLSKAKDWAKHAKETPTGVESLTYCLEE